MKNVNIRVPSWAEGATLSWGSVPPMPVPAGKLFETSCNSVALEMMLTIPLKTRVTRRFNNAVSIYRGYNNLFNVVICCFVMHVLLILLF